MPYWVDLPMPNGQLECRLGKYGTANDAKSVPWSDGRGGRSVAVIYEVTDDVDVTNPGEGVVVSAFTPKHGWIDVAEVREPQWWDAVPEHVREWLLDHDDEPMPSWVWTSIVRHWGMVYTVRWESGPESDLMLTVQDDEWLAFHRALRAA